MAVQIIAGSTIKNELSITDTATGQLVNIADYAVFEVWFYTKEDNIIKFARDVTPPTPPEVSEYKELIKVDNYNYIALIDASESISLEPEMYKVEIKIAVTDADAEDGIFINLTSETTDLQIISKPIGYVES